MHPDEFIGRIVFYFGDLDPRISWVCRRIIRPGDAVVDVGANYGVVSLLAADLVGSSGLVHAFEPQPQVADLLRRSTLQNGFAHLHVHEIGLSEADAMLEMHVPVGHLGGASLDRVASPGSSITVEVRHAGSVLDELGLPHVRLLKIDIEGHEAQFLRGARKFIESSPPDVILFESNDRLYANGQCAPFWERYVVLALRSGGYDLFRVSQRLAAFGPRLIRVKPDSDDRGLDFVAVHQTKYDELAAALGIS